MESLVGHTSGFAIPRYVVDAPGGGGKIPVMPNYIISWSTNKVILRNYEGVITTYKEPDHYETMNCAKNCSKCDFGSKPEEETGVKKLLSNKSKTISLVPEGNTRLKRRVQNQHKGE